MSDDQRDAVQSDVIGSKPVTRPRTRQLPVHPPSSRVLTPRTPRVVSARRRAARRRPGEPDRSRQSATRSESLHSGASRVPLNGALGATDRPRVLVSPRARRPHLRRCRRGPQDHAYAALDRRRRQDKTTGSPTAETTSVHSRQIRRELRRAVVSAIVSACGEKRSECDQLADRRRHIADRPTQQCSLHRASDGRYGEPVAMEDVVQRRR
jgi:hypothetical protein